MKTQIPSVFVALVLLFLAVFVPALIAACRMEANARRQKREREQAAAQRAQQARQRKEREQAKPANAPTHAAQPNRKRGRPRKVAADPVPVSVPATAAPEQRRETVLAPAPALPHIKGNNAFAGQVLAFTGRLEGMSRAQAIKLVQDNGGRAFKDLYVGHPLQTTMLVVADELMRRGDTTVKLEKADQYISQIRKITEAQFKDMLAQPLTLTPDEFAAVAAELN